MVEESKNRESLKVSGLREVREEIVNAAREVFGRYGFRKSTMDEIARAARKGKSSLYHYFKSKEDVFRAVVEKEGNILEQQMEQALKKEETPQAKLCTYTLKRMEILNRVANFYSAFKDEYLEQYAFIQRIRKKYDAWELATIKGILQEGVDKGIFVVKDLELSAFTIVTTMKGLEYHWAMQKDVSKIKNGINSLFGILFDGIMKR
ncbi:TetR/AcrR family transcriptional regulator [candidate division WOR-3 bacterium]|nr:TetR/AcrR family transcriptional regulator [candidate division WOR-3 bacterium]